VALRSAIDFQLESLYDLDRKTKEENNLIIKKKLNLSLSSTGSNLDKSSEDRAVVYGNDSTPMIKRFADNFDQALSEIEHRLPAKKFKSFEVLEDLGCEDKIYKNAGGGQYDGSYRSFRVNDRFGETQTVSILICGTDPDFRGENRGGYTSLIVGIDNSKSKVSHASLQYNVDRYSKIDLQGHIEFIHDGRIGSFKKADVVAKVEKYGTCLKVSNEKIELGSLPMDKSVYLDDNEVSNFVYRLIEYALLREEVRRDKRR
jgi:hypothetical protein